MNIPTINVDSEALDSDKLSEHLQMLNEELALRTQLMCFDNFGIIALSDPKLYNNNITNPLWVGAVDALTVYVNPGKAITRSGKSVELAERANANLTALSEKTLNVVLLQCELIDDEEYVLASNGQITSTGSHYVTSLKVVPLDNYNAMNTSVKDDCVILSFVAYSSVGSQFIVESNSYNIRPWFSSVDREHRSKIGSGDVTPTNIHGLGLNDLSSGGVKLYEQLTTTGMLLSKDSSIAGVPGYLCYDEYVASDIKADTTGEVTKRSFFTGVGVYYLELNSYPNTICCVLGPADQNGNRFEYAVDHIVGTKILVFYSSVKPGAVTVHYTRSPSLSITSRTPSSVTFGQVDNRELVVASGEGLSSVKNTAAFVRKYGGIPINIRFEVNARAEVVIDPKVVLSSKHPTEIVGVKQTINMRFTSPCYIGIGATKLGDAVDRNMFVKVVGIDNQDNAIEEVLEFDSTWEDTYDVVGSYEKSNQIKYTSTSWNSIDHIEVLNDPRHPFMSCSPEGYIVSYAKLDPAKHKNAVIATAFWNGRELKRLEDTRRILPTVRDGVYGSTPITSIGELVAGVNEIFVSQNTAQKRIQNIISEDFQQPRFLNAPTVIWQGREVLDVDPLPTTVVDSSNYANVYRSRSIPLRKMPHDNLGLLVVLYNTDYTRITSGSVRVVVRDDTKTYECALKLYERDFMKRTFIGYFTYNWKAVSFVISGKCQGFSAYYVNPVNFDMNLVVTPTPLWSM